MNTAAWVYLAAWGVSMAGWGYTRNQWRRCRARCAWLTAANEAALRELSRKVYTGPNGGQA